MAYGTKHILRATNKLVNTDNFIKTTHKTSRTANI